jgi:hypothetical protein
MALNPKLRCIRITSNAKKLKKAGGVDLVRVWLRDDSTIYAERTEGAKAVDL